MVFFFNGTAPTGTYTLSRHGAVPIYKHPASRGSEKHFRVVVVAEAFAGRPRVARHRMITRLLADELKGPLHALSLVALTAEEWKASAGDVGESPPCLGREKPARG